MSKQDTAVAPLLPFSTHAQRVALSELPITLDGSPARLGGFRLDFPFVESKATGERVEFAWQTVAHVIANSGGAFKSGRKAAKVPTQKAKRAANKVAKTRKSKV